MIQHLERSDCSDVSLFISECVRLCPGHPWEGDFWRGPRSSVVDGHLSHSVWTARTSRILTSDVSTGGWHKGQVMQAHHKSAAAVTTTCGNTPVEQHVLCKVQLKLQTVLHSAHGGFSTISPRDQSRLHYECALICLYFVLIERGLVAFKTDLVVLNNSKILP